MFKSVLICATWLVFWVGNSRATAAETFIPTDSMRGDFIGRYTEHLEDKTKALTLADVRSEKYRSKFATINTDTPNYGLSESAHWFRLTVNNPASNKIGWLLQAEHPHLKHIEAYEILRNGEIRFHEGGE
jgi:hypothetical protein